jgi:hypothetical protein
MIASSLSSSIYVFFFSARFLFLAVALEVVLAFPFPAPKCANMSGSSENSASDFFTECYDPLIEVGL